MPKDFRSTLFACFIYFGTSNRRVVSFINVVMITLFLEFVALLRSFFTFLDTQAYLIFQINFILIIEIISGLCLNLFSANT